MTVQALLSELRQRNVTLWLDADRLRYRAAKDALTPDLLAQIKAHKANIIDFLQQAITNSNAQLPPILPIDRQAGVPLSFAQQRFWLLNQLEPQSSANNMPVVVRFTGTLDISILERSLQAVIQRHEVLRSTYPAIDGRPTLVIASEVMFSLPLIDFEHLPSAQRDQAVFQRATEVACLPFDLVQGPIMRVMLFRLSQHDHLMLWNMHCMVCDGASSDVFYQDLTALYTAFSAGQPSPLRNLPIQYSDFAHWQRQWLQGEVLETQVNYWRQRLSGHLPLLQLPCDRPHPMAIRTYRGNRGARMLPQSLATALTTLSQKSGATLFMTLLAAFEVLLYRYSQQEDMLISFASAGRGQMETEGLLGFFSNTLILRTNLTGNPTFRELLQRVRAGSLEAYAHQDLPFEKLIEELRPEPNQSLLPLFQVKFALNPPWSKGRGMAPLHLPGLTIRSLFGYIYPGATKYDLTLVMREQDEGLGMVFDYNAEIFEASTIDRMLGHFQTLLEGIVAKPDHSIAELPLLTPAESHQLLEINHPACLTSVLANRVDQIFAMQANRTPDAIAVAFKDKQLTYQALNDQANQLAQYLQMLGVQSGDCVALCLQRSPELIVGMLGILKAGASYLVLNPDNVQMSSMFGLEVAQVYLLITQTHLTEAFSGPSWRVVDLDKARTEIAHQTTVTPNIDSLASPTIACITRSSKPIESQFTDISHHGIIQLAKSPDWIDLGPKSIFLQLSPIFSGMALFEIWGCLLNGGRLILAPETILPSDQSLGHLIAHHQITTLGLPTRWFNRLVNEQLSNLKSVRQLLIRGDVVAVPQVQKFLSTWSDCQLLNVYSPAAHLPITSYYPIKSATQLISPRPIGQAIAGTQNYLLDRHLQPVAMGVRGELYISNSGLAQRQISNSPESESWLINPFSAANSTYLYRTGDRARWLTDGTLEWLSPMSRSLKVRNFPVELDQVEAALTKHSSLQETCILVHQDVVTGDDYLVAYGVPTLGQVINPNELSTFLKQQFPAYMVPSAFFSLEEMPLTPDGDLDRDLLFQFNDRTNSQSQISNAVTFRDDLELQLTKIWEETIGVQSIGIRDNFFELGGHSLLAVRLFAQIEAALGYQFPLSTLLEAPTIEQQADMLRSQGTLLSQEWLIPLQQGTADTPPLFCIYGILLYHDLARHLGPQQTVYGLYLQEEVDLLLENGETQSSSLTSVPQVATLYLQKIRIIQPKGPYLLAGESFGGLVAYEIAQQLQAQGEQVDLVALFDTQAPGISLKLPYWQRGILHLEQLMQQGPSYLTQRLTSKVSISQNQAKTVIKTIDDNADDNRVNNTSADSQSLIIDRRRYQFRHEIRKHYVPQPYAGKVILFRAMETVSQFESIAMNPQFGWSSLAINGLEIYDVPGDHIGILKAPNVCVLANALRDCIDRSQAQH